MSGPRHTPDHRGKCLTSRSNLHGPKATSVGTPDPTVIRVAKSRYHDLIGTPGDATVSFVRERSSSVIWRDHLVRVLGQHGAAPLWPLFRVAKSKRLKATACRVAIRWSTPLWPRIAAGRCARAAMASGCRTLGWGRTERLTHWRGSGFRRAPAVRWRGRADPFRAFGGLKGATTRLTAPAYWKFESTPLQR